MCCVRLSVLGALETGLLSANINENPCYRLIAIMGGRNTRRGVIGSQVMLNLKAPQGLFSTWFREKYTAIL
jgi:hypothetical protein